MSRVANGFLGSSEKPVILGASFRVSILGLPSDSSSPQVVLGANQVVPVTLSDQEMELLGQSPTFLYVN